MPAVKQSSVARCTQICRGNPKCGWFGFRRADAYCEFWTAGSCSNPHTQQGHDIYRVVHGGSDAHSGWYDLRGCGACNDYCRWVGNCGHGGDPSERGIIFTCSSGTSVWSCETDTKIRAGPASLSAWRTARTTKCRTKGATVQNTGALKTCDVVTLRNVARSQANELKDSKDCAGKVCTDQPWPPPSGHWGTPLKVMRMDSVACGQAIKSGDSIWLAGMKTPGVWPTGFSYNQHYIHMTERVIRADDNNVGGFGCCSYTSGRVSQVTDYHNNPTNFVVNNVDGHHNQDQYRGEPPACQWSACRRDGAIVHTAHEQGAGV